MAGASWRTAVAAGIALAAGFAGGWVAGRASVPPPPPPEAFRNPLADTKAGETLLLRRGDGETTLYRVQSVDATSVLIAEETHPPVGPALHRVFRVSRAYLGFFYILEGDVDPVEAAATARDFVPAEITRDSLHSEPLRRSFDCWKIRGHHRAQGEMTLWVSPELPVHGLLRVDTVKGMIWEAIGRGE